MMSEAAIEIDWEIDGRTGWGLIGLHLALELHRLGHRIVTTDIAYSTVEPMLAESLRHLARSQRAPTPRVRLAALGNKMKGPRDVGDWHDLGLAVFEDSVISTEARTRLRGFDALVAPSAWCAGILSSVGVQCAGVWHQGYDEVLFREGPRRRLDDRFFVFSGGKLEFRKGQDIVVEAFRRFLKTPEGQNAVLVTAWQNPWPHTLSGVNASGYVCGLPEIHNGSLDMSPWLESNGIPVANMINLGYLSQPELASVMRECDVALFPNRAEGATNLVLAECLGSGLPCIASWNTGHREYAGVQHLIPLQRQRPVPYQCGLYRGTDDWGECDPDECVEHLRLCRSTQGGGTQQADVQQFAAQWGWHASAASLSNAIHDVIRHPSQIRSAGEIDDVPSRSCVNRSSSSLTTSSSFQ